MNAAISSTFGNYPVNREIIRELRQLVLQSPHSYNGKPCCVLGLVGPPGSNKSTIINRLISSLLGGEFELQRSSHGAESVSSTTENLLIPIHTVLFSDPDPPAYFFIWDTIGLKQEASREYSPDDVAPAIQNLLNGKLRSYSSSLVVIDEDADIAIPCHGIIVTHHSSKNLKNVLQRKGNYAQEASFLRSLNERCSTYQAKNSGMQFYEHYRGVPLYCLATSLELLEPIDSPIFNQETRSENWNFYLTSSSLVQQMHNLSSATNIPYGRCFPTFGLDVLRPTRDSNDVRITALLIPFVSIVREVVTASRMRHQLALVHLQRDGIKDVKTQKRSIALMYMTIEELYDFLKKHPLLGEDAATIAKQSSINGQNLLELSDEQIYELWGNLLDIV